MFDLFDDVGDMLGSGARNMANYFKGREVISTTKLQGIIFAMKDSKVQEQILDTIKTEILKEFKNDGSIGDNPFEKMVITPAGDKK